MARTAHRFDLVQESATFALADMVKRLRADGESIADLGGGEPDFDTPAHIITAAEESLRSGFTHYVASRGHRPLLTAIAADLKKRGLDYNPDTDIIVTPSAKHALFITMLALVDPGDEVLIPSPSWVSYESMLHMMGAKPVFVPLAATDDFVLTRDKLEAKVSSRTRAIMLNSPNNPTGRVLSRAELEDVVAVAREHDLIIVSDEIYDRIVYDGRENIATGTLLDAFDRTVTINGFSKAYAMTGWRLGYLAGPKDIVAEALKAQQHSVGCAASFVQVAAVAGLEGPQSVVDEMVQDYDERRRMIVDGLNELPGITCAMPEGAFYAFPNIEGTGFTSSVEFCTWLLKEAKVAVNPGFAFGPGGEGHVRFSYANSRQAIATALERMGKALESRLTVA